MASLFLETSPKSLRATGIISGMAKKYPVLTDAGRDTCTSKTRSAGETRLQHQCEQQHAKLHH